MRQNCPATCVALGAALTGLCALSSGCKSDSRCVGPERDVDYMSPVPGPNDVSAMVFSRAIDAGEPADLNGSGVLRPIASSTSVICGVRYVAYEDAAGELVYIKQTEGFTGRESWFVCRRCCWESAF